MDRHSNDLEYFPSSKECIESSFFKYNLDRIIVASTFCDLAECQVFSSKLLAFMFSAG